MMGVIILNVDLILSIIQYNHVIIVKFNLLDYFFHFEKHLKFV